MTLRSRARTWQHAERYWSPTVEQSPLDSHAQQALRSVEGSLLAQQASRALGPCGRGRGDRVEGDGLR